jgi:hypothetical protein
MMTGRHHVYAYARFLCAVGALSLLTACAGQSWTRPAIPPMENQPPVKVADVDILKVSSEMIEFAEQHAPRNLKHANKAFNLAYASLDRNFLNFRYDPSVTLSAEDAFRLKQGNCLSFSSMIVAMARAAGLVAWYQEVDVPQEWSSINETLLVARHVTAVVEDQHLEYVVDISRKYNEQDRKNRDHFGTYHWRRKISDKEALAQFYNNLGVDALMRSTRTMTQALSGRTWVSSIAGTARTKTPKQVTKLLWSLTPGIQQRSITFTHCTLSREMKPPPVMCRHRWKDTGVKTRIICSNFPPKRWNNSATRLRSV